MGPVVGRPPTEAGGGRGAESGGCAKCLQAASDVCLLASLSSALTACVVVDTLGRYPALTVAFHAVRRRLGPLPARRLRLAADYRALRPRGGVRHRPHRLTRNQVFASPSAAAAIVAGRAANGRTAWLSQETRTPTGSGRQKESTRQ
ncbi:DUF4357 domain-containing protein [Brevibacterium luteolum]|uniref:DUF4357 domain-containing protein n=1 Tax=Brevibacterium luteolum TaxID=199591 RepID=UPI00387A414A